MSGRSRIELLVDALVEATAKGRARWHIGDDRQVVVFDGPAGSVVLYPVSGDEKLPFAIEVRSDQGEVLDAKVTTYTPDRTDLTPFSRQIEELYHLARDSTVSTVADAILADLGKPVPPSTLPRGSDQT